MGLVTVSQDDALSHKEGVMPANEFDFSRQLSDLRAVASRLNEESDSINTIIEQLQESLKTLNLGVEAWVQVQSEEATITMLPRSQPSVPAIVETSVGYARGQDGWALWVKRVAYRANTMPNPLVGIPIAMREPVKVHPWLKLVEAARPVRIAALDAVPRLLDALKAAADSAVQSIQSAKKLLQ